MRDFFVDALATFRLTRLLTEDVITSPVREKILKKYPPTEESWSYALTCPWCASVWAGLGVMAARRMFPAGWDAVATGLAASAVTGLVSERQANHGSL